MTVLLDTLISYVPTVVTRRVALDPTPLAAPLAEHFPAVVLFADISGFTSLAERLAQQGPAGAEELSRILNAYFGQLIDLITAQGGDVVKFAGDSLLALWPVAEKGNGRSPGTEDEPPDAPSPSALATAALAAAQCSLEAQRILSTFEIEETRLALRMGVGVGEAFVVHLGGVYGLWQFLVAGDVLTQVNAAERQARPGQVVVSPEVWELLRSWGKGSPLPADGVHLESLPESISRPASAAPRRLPPGADTALKAYIPGAILSRVVAGQTAWLAELRRVAVVFVNLPDLNHKTSLEQAHNAIRTLQNTLYRYEGSVNNLSVDDKGISLVAAFGLPPLAHEDDSTRAAQAALAMQAELEKLELRYAIGVTTGRAFCGTIGNDRRREYTLIGDVVNLAARLMQAAANDILCDSFTYQDAREEIEFEALAAISVKGKAKQIPIYRPRGELPQRGVQLAHSPRSQTAIVGRNAERMLLSEQLQMLLRGGVGGEVIIEGEAGMGKSRLVEDLLQHAQMLGVDSLVGAGDAIEKSTPFYAWRPVVSRLLNLEAQSDSESGRCQALNRLGLEPEWNRLIPLLNSVLFLDLPDNETTLQLTGQVRLDNLRDLLLQLLQHATAERPRLLVLEDAHWLDSASWTLAWYASQRVKSMLFVLATRPLTEPLPAEYSHLLNASTAHRLSITTLSPAETLQLVSQRLGVTALPEPVAELIRDKAEGNPFFSEELAYALRDSGWIEIADGECQLVQDESALRAMAFPDTVQGVITSRIDRLTPSQQLTLKVASVIGRVFEFNILDAIYPVADDKHYLRSYLTALAKLDLTPLDMPDPNLTYIFKHIITREVAYNLMLFAQRRQLHQAAAEWYEHTYAENLATFYQLLAYHWGQAEIRDKAIDYLEKAGEQALLNFANEEAVEAFSRALALATEQGAEARSPAARLRCARWELHLGEAYTQWTKYSEAQTHLEAGLALLGYPTPQSTVSLAVRLLGQALRQWLHRRWPARYVGRFAAQRAILLEAARAYEHLVEIYYFANEAYLSVYAAFCSLNLAEAAGPSPETVRGYATLGAIMGAVPLHNLAEAYCSRGLKASQQEKNLSARAWVALVTGMYYAGIGRWAKSRSLFESVIEIAERLGDNRRWDDGVSNLAIVDYLLGNFGECAKLSEALYVSASRRGDAGNMTWALRGKVYCLLPWGKLEEALACLEEIQTLIRETNNVDEPLKIDLQGMLAITQMRLGNRRQAEAAAEEALRLIAKASPTSYISLPGYAGVAKMYMTVWETELAAGATPAALKRIQVQANKACQGLRKFTGIFPIGQPRALLWQGLYEWLTGNQAKAYRDWRKGLAAAETLGLPYEQGLAHYEIGRHLAPDDPQRRSHLNQACEILARLGATFDLQRAEKALAQ